MKESIEELLTTLQILPISNPIWKKFEVTLYSNSTLQQFQSVKEIIRDNVSEGIGGLYIIAKNNKILYVGESEERIRYRLRRHMEKIFSRTDSRSDFFKLGQYQGKLTIFFMQLPSNLINQRKAIEDLLTNALEPEYKRWDFKNKMLYLEKLFGKERIINKTIAGTTNKTDKDIVYSQLISQAKNCQLCVAMKDKEAVIGYKNGNLNADIMFIAEAPGPRGADISGIPLHGDETGKNFEKLLSSINWTRSDVFITNAVLCCPTNENGKVRPPNKSEVKNCSSHLARIIDLVNPKVVVTLGKKALEALNDIEKHQLVFSNDIATFTKWNNRWLYPLYHPSPQVINTRKRTYEQQETDFKQLAHKYPIRISKGLEPINFQSKN